MRVMCNAVHVLCNDTNTGCHSLISYIFGPRNLTVESVLNHWWLWLGYRQYCCEVYSLFISLALWTLCKFGWSVAMGPIQNPGQITASLCSILPSFHLLVSATVNVKAAKFLCQGRKSQTHLQHWKSFCKLQLSPSGGLANAGLRHVHTGFIFLS